MNTTTTRTRAFVLSALVELNEEGGPVSLICKAAETAGFWCVRFESREGFPVFDPVNGDTCLSGQGATMADALADLAAVLMPYYPPIAQEPTEGEVEAQAYPLSAAASRAVLEEGGQYVPPSFALGARVVVNAPEVYGQPAALGLPGVVVDIRPDAYVVQLEEEGLGEYTTPGRYLTAAPFASGDRVVVTTSPVPGMVGRVGTFGDEFAAPGSNLYAVHFVNADGSSGTVPFRPSELRMATPADESSDYAASVADEADDTPPAEFIAQADAEADELAAESARISQEGADRAAVEEAICASRHTRRGA